ncbi:MAG: preprotein translocase subunit YajC [Tissierellia bacterium]|nr:preprotein translocase subunit YajC [Tissierellia bacterium]
MSNILALQAQSAYTSLFFFALVGIGFYFLVVKPGQKQQAKQKETMESMKVGDQIVTRSGVRGRIVSLDDVSFVIETGPEYTKIEFLKAALAYIVTPAAGYEESMENNREDN